MTRRKPNRQRSKWQSLYLWHRYIGLTAAILVVVLSVTGLMLNHTEALHLDETAIDSEGLLSWYGIHSDIPEAGYQAGDYTISQMGAHLYLNDIQTPLKQASDDQLIGAIWLEDHSLLAVATRQTLALITPQAEIIETISTTSGLPGELEAIGLSGQTPIIRVADADYQSTDLFLSWEAIATKATHWSSEATLPYTLVNQLKLNWQGEGLPLERVVLDIHSGRIMGNAGVYIMDAAAIACMLLAGSGVWIWIKQRISRRRRRVQSRKAK